MRIWMTPRSLALILTSALMLACGGGGGSERRCNGGGGDNRLEGSYCEDVEMVFTDVRVTRLQSGDQTYARVEYVRPQGTGLEKTLMVVFVADAPLVEAETTFPLLDVGGAVTRVLSTGAVDLTTELEGSSSITLDRWSGALGSVAAGRVDLAFMNGRRLSAVFEASIEDALPAQ